MVLVSVKSVVITNVPLSTGFSGVGADVLTSEVLVSDVLVSEVLVSEVLVSEVLVSDVTGASEVLVSEVLSLISLVVGSATGTDDSGVLLGAHAASAKDAKSTTNLFVFIFMMILLMQFG